MALGLKGSSRKYSKINVLHVNVTKQTKNIRLPDFILQSLDVTSNTAHKNFYILPLKDQIISLDTRLNLCNTHMNDSHVKSR